MGDFQPRDSYEKNSYKKETVYLFLITFMHTIYSLSRSSVLFIPYHFLLTIWWLYYHLLFVIAVLPQDLTSSFERSVLFRNNIFGKHLHTSPSLMKREVIATKLFLEREVGKSKGFCSSSQRSYSIKKLLLIISQYS